MLELSKERRKWDKSNEVWEGVEREKRKHFFVPSPPPFPFFALAPTLRVTILLSLIFLHHKIKDGGYNNTNINKQLSPTENTPALQAIIEVGHSIKIHHKVMK